MTRQSEPRSAPRTKGSWLSYGRVCSRKQLGRIPLHEQCLMYGKKKGAQQNKQRQQKGIISINVFFLSALDKPQEEKCCGINICSLGTGQSPRQALWPVCPHVPEACICASPARRPRRWPRKRPVLGQDALHCLQLGLRGSNSHSVVFDMTKTTSKGRTNTNCRYMQLGLALFAQVSTIMFYCSHQSDQLFCSERD